MSEVKPNDNIEMYQEWLKDKRIRDMLLQDDETLKRIFNNPNTYKLLLEDEYAKKFIDENCVTIHTANGIVLAHKSELPFRQTNKDV